MLTYHSITNIGNRETNEDSALCLRRGEDCCFAVADGLGGHAHGEDASRKFVEVVGREFESADFEDARSFLAKAFSAAQDEILKLQKTRSAKFEMKTTGVALIVTDGKCAWAHCGDSRLYMFRKNKARIRTLDHSVPQMLALSGELKEKKIARHPDRNRLLRVLGVEWDSPRFEVSDELDVSGVQAFLLCTDGFWEFIEQKEMERRLKKSPSPEEWLSAMTSYVESNGAGADMDNYTAIAVMARENT
ncbi:MAG: protein phosphatase 2C domain-containing protein [Oscillospiraceae bacterium]|jgi:serine/threonine protein phosphatase PrpC|nr:protein phosphatase 2C domain-containing protein [Oscillospiraceae bacterium]